MNLAVIPARSGSKRIPDKNIKCFAGRPIIKYTIEAAISSSVFDSIIVSTDSEAIARIAVDSGASVPFIRPSDLADDFTPIRYVVKHALEWKLLRSEKYDFVCCLYPAAPFVSCDDLRKSLALLEQSSANFVLTVSSYPHPIQKALWIENERIRVWRPEYKDCRTQDLDVMYRPVGLFCWGRAVSIMAGASALSDDTIPFYIPYHLAIDIDNDEDWRLAECQYRALNC